MFTIILSVCSIALSVYVVVVTSRRSAELRRMGAESMRMVAWLESQAGDQSIEWAALRAASTGWKLPPPRMRRIDQG
jgi:hypothetical protein